MKLNMNQIHQVSSVNVDADNTNTWSSAIALSGVHPGMIQFSNVADATKNAGGMANSIDPDQIACLDQSIPIFWI